MTRRASPRRSSAGSSRSTWSGADDHWYCREHHLCRNLLDSWRQARPSVEEVSRQLRAAKQRIADLEAALGRSAMETDFLKRCLKQAKLPLPTGLQP